MLSAVRIHSLVRMVIAVAASAATGGLVAAHEPGLAAVAPLSVGPTVRADAPSDPKLGMTPDPVCVVAGLRILQSGQWRPVPDQLPREVPVELAVEVRNLGTAGTAVLTAAAEVWPLDESEAVHVMSGAATVVLAPGAAHFLQLWPPWRPLSHGSYRIFGTAAEGGLAIGSFSETVQVLGGTAVCPVPGVNLP
jgi:hypothetical protein